MPHCLHCFISGKVQNVFFRASTQEKAQALQLTGWVKNLNDGRVEVYANSDNQTTLTEFRQWLTQGPAAASVDSVNDVATNYQPFQDFAIID